MFKVNNTISDNIFEFSSFKNGVVYISHLIGEKNYKITKLVEEKKLFDKPDIFISRPLIIKDNLFVGKSGGGGFVYNENLTDREEINFHFWVKSSPCSLFMKPGGEILVMGFVDNLTMKIQWQLDYYSTINFIGKDLFYTIKNVDNKNNHVYAYDKKTGEEKWLYVIETDKIYGGIKFKVEYKNQIYLHDAHFDRLISLDSETGKLLSSQSGGRGMLFYENDIPFIGNFFGKLNLETKEETKFDFEPLLIPYWDKFQQTTHIDCIADGHILVGTHQFLTEVVKEDPTKGVFNLLAIDPNKNKVVWDYQFPYYGLANYKEARYENGKLYFLDQEGTLTIFEKET